MKAFWEEIKHNIELEKANYKVSKNIKKIEREYNKLEDDLIKSTNKMLAQMRI